MLQAHTKSQTSPGLTPVRISDSGSAVGNDYLHNSVSHLEQGEYPQAFASVTSPTPSSSSR